MTPTAILDRLREDREFWRDRVNEADDDSYGRLAAQSRVDCLSTVLSWLPKELDRLVIAVRAEEDELPCCDHCDETADHGGECQMRIRVTGADVARDLEWDGALPIGDVIGTRHHTDTPRHDTAEDLLFDQLLENAQ